MRSITTMEIQLKLFLVSGIMSIVIIQVTTKVFSVGIVPDSVKRSSFTRFYDKTLGTIQACVDNLQKPGDECVIQPGRYHENVTIMNKHGTREDPIIIRGDPSGTTTVDGTIPLNPTKWEKFTKGAYKTVLKQDIWQLFIDGEMMTNARWPNALWSDKTIFDSQNWAHSSTQSSRGFMIDGGGSHKLAESGLDATGAMAVLNVGSFCTFTRRVLKHQIGGDRFTYRDDLGPKLNFKPKNCIYFLEDKLEFLDNPGEWFYDKTSKTLYVMTPDGGSPEGRDVRGKVQSFAFTITSSSHVIIKDMTFFATTLQAISFTRKNFVNNLTLHSLNFRFPSYSRRMLQDSSPPKWTKVFVSNTGTSRIINNTFYGTDGMALEYNGVDNLVENNLFEFNDWTGNNMDVATGGAGTVVSQSKGDNFIRNTLRFNGASVGYRAGFASVAKLNDISRQCWGMLQHDGAGIQVMRKRQTNIILQQNWIHYSPKYGLRFDGAPPKTGEKGTMKQNVVWRTNGLMVKGYKHMVDHNLVFHKFDKDGDHDGSEKCTLCVLKYVRENPVEVNQNTAVVYNAADVANGGEHGGVLYDLNGILTGNVIGDVRKQLMDADNMDFRPKQGSLYINDNVGPYSFEETKTNYWIPGRKLYTASNPVPPNKAPGVKAAARDALMWLNSFEGMIHEVYLGSTPNDLKKIGITMDEDNVMKLTAPLEDGRQYFWRVDAVINKEVTYKGDVWSFMTMPASLGQNGML